MSSTASSVAPSPESPVDVIASADTGAVAARCPSCEGELLGAYCHRCGERRPQADDFTLGRFAREAGAELTDLDSTTARSLRLLLLHPGALVAEYLRGRRRLYVGPLKLYLVVFAVLMAIATLLAPPAGQPRDTAASALDAGVVALVNAVAERRGIPVAEADKALVGGAREVFSWLSVGIPLVFGCVLAVVLRKRRRKFGEHLVFATYTTSFYFLTAIFLIPIQYHAQRLGPEVVASLTAGMTVVIWVYLALSLRRVYGASKIGGAAWGLVLVVGFVLSQSVIGALAMGATAVRLLYF